MKGNGFLCVTLALALYSALSFHSSAAVVTLEARAMACLAPLPPPLSSKEEGSFAEYTFQQRLPAVLKRVEKQSGEDGRELLSSLLHGTLANVAWGMPCGCEGEGAREGESSAVEYENENGKVTKRIAKKWKPMLDDWSSFCQAQREGIHWREMEPAISMESLFYRKVLEASGYFSSSSPLSDPFLEQKNAARNAAGERLEALASLGNSCSRNVREEGGESALDLKTCTITLLHASLWGNRADLSLEPSAGLVDGIPIDEEGQHHHSLVQEILEQKEYLLVDDSEQWFSYASERESGVERLDFVTDNVGLELGADMTLIAHLLDSELAQVVTVHLKFHPTFVSDVTRADWNLCLQWLSDGGGGESGRALAAKLFTFMEERRLKITDNVYWTGPRLFWQLPERMAEETFGGSDTTIFKGDANYRKLVGDRKWQLTERSFEDVVSYFPSPVLALRTAKAETVAGVTREAQLIAAAHDPHWMTNGRWGSVQFSHRRNIQ